MIHELGALLGAYLRAAGCPFRVVDGPEPSQQATFARERIVIEHDPDATDSFGPPHSQGANPARRFVRSVACKATIYAQSPRAGAMSWEHRARAEIVLDLVVAGLYSVIKQIPTFCAISRGRFVVPADLAKTEIPGGAAYELSFMIERGVVVAKWDGSFRPEQDDFSLSSTTNVRGPNNGAPEIGCGG